MKRNVLIIYYILHYNYFLKYPFVMRQSYLPNVERNHNFLRFPTVKPQLPNRRVGPAVDNAILTYRLGSKKLILQFPFYVQNEAPIPCIVTTTIRSSSLDTQASNGVCIYGIEAGGGMQHTRTRRTPSTCRICTKWIALYMRAHTHLHTGRQRMQRRSSASKLLHNIYLSNYI